MCVGLSVCGVFCLLVCLRVGLILWRCICLLVYSCVRGICFVGVFVLLVFILLVSLRVGSCVSGCLRGGLFVCGVLYSLVHWCVCLFVGVFVCCPLCVLTCVCWFIRLLVYSFDGSSVCLFVECFLHWSVVFLICVRCLLFT